MIYRPQSIDLLIEDIRLHRDQVIISGRRQQETLILELHAAYFLHRSMRIAIIDAHYFTSSERDKIIQFVCCAVHIYMGLSKKRCI